MYIWVDTFLPCHMCVTRGTPFRTVDSPAVTTPGIKLRHGDSYLNPLGHLFVPASPLRLMCVSISMPGACEQVRTTVESCCLHVVCGADLDHSFCVCVLSTHKRLDHRLVPPHPIFFRLCGKHFYLRSTLLTQFPFLRKYWDIVYMPYTSILT